MGWSSDWLLHGMCRLLRPRVVVEIGRFYGFSMVLLAEACKDNGVGHVWSIDPVDRWEPKRLKKIDREELTDWFTLVHGKSEDMGDFVPDSIDLLYIDGDHSYEACSLDIEMYGSRVRKDGVMLLDDVVGCEGVTRAVKELSRQDWEVISFPDNELRPELKGLAIARRL